MNKGFYKYLKLIDAFIISLFIFLNLIFTNIYAQVPVMQKSVMAIGGSSQNIDLNENTVYIRQSIGQNGISGTSKKNNIILIQGFIFPQMSVRGVKENENLDVEIKSIDNLNAYNIFINTRSIYDFKISLYTLQGKKIYFNHLKNNQFTIDLNRFPKGIYILSINSLNKYFSKKLIKY